MSIVFCGWISIGVGDSCAERVAVPSWFEFVGGSVAGLASASVEGFDRGQGTPAQVEPLISGNIFFKYCLIVARSSSDGGAYLGVGKAELGN